MRKHNFFVPIILFVSTFVQAQTWNAPINVIGPYSGTGGSLGYPNSLLVVNGNPAMAAFDGTRANLVFIRANDQNGTIWGTPITIDSIGSVGTNLSMQIVNGNPAIAYYDFTNGNLKYIRAMDASGMTWGPAVNVDITGNVGTYTSIQIVNGNPAISYYDITNGNLKYVRAGDTNGNTWSAPLTIDVTGVVGQHTSLQIVNGNPAISYYASTNDDLKYVRATDVNGNAWGTPVIADANGGQYTSLQVINGNPAIAYGFAYNNQLYYVRATDAAGTTWATPISVDPASAFPEGISLKSVNGKPAISYGGSTAAGYKVFYVHSNDVSGATWSSPVPLGDGIGYSTSICIVNGNPAVSYGVGNNTNLGFTRSVDLDGASWSTPLTFSVTPFIASFGLSQKVVNGNPAISYYDATNSILKYIRANDALGVSWAGPKTVDATFGLTGKYSSMQIVNSNPAISYSYTHWNNSANKNLTYVRANDITGNSWGTPITIDYTFNGNNGEFNSLQVVNGNPAIVYCSKEQFLPAVLKYVRANDANGSAWGTPVSLGPATGSTVISLLVVNGNPSIVYINAGLKFMRATNADGTAWGAPITIDPDVSIGGADLQIINGNPAISYHNTSADLKYVRSADANGAAWGTPVFVDVNGNGLESTSLQVVGGNPAISYHDYTNGDLKYVRATDANGTGWAAPVYLDTTGYVGQYNSMQIVSGLPTIAYNDVNNGLLKFISSSNTASINSALNITSTCIGSGFSVGYSSANATFNAGNVFTAQLSDAAGSFTSPVNIGTYNSTSANGTINVIIPSNTPAGSNYLIRVVSSDPVITGSASNSFIVSTTNSWTGAVSTEWENPANWSCGSVPDGYTDVVINSGTVILNSNGTCRTLTVMPGASFTVTPGFNLTVIH